MTIECPNCPHNTYIFVSFVFAISLSFLLLSFQNHCIYIVVYDKIAMEYQKPLSVLNFPESVPKGYQPKPVRKLADWNQETQYRGVARRNNGV